MLCFGRNFEFLWKIFGGFFGGSFEGKLKRNGEKWRQKDYHLEELEFMRMNLNNFKLKKLKKLIEMEITRSN